MLQSAIAPPASSLMGFVLTLNVDRLVRFISEYGCKAWDARLYNFFICSNSYLIHITSLGY